MDTIECGSMRLALEIGNDGIGVAHFNGLLLPGNIRAVNAITLGVAAAAASRACCTAAIGPPCAATRSR